MRRLVLDCYRGDVCAIRCSIYAELIRPRALALPFRNTAAFTVRCRRCERSLPCTALGEARGLRRFGETAIDGAEIGVTLKCHGPTQANVGSKDRVLVYRINQLLHRILHGIALVVPEAVFAADGLNERSYIVQLVLGWKRLLGGEGRVEQSIPDILLPCRKVNPRKDSPGVHSTGRIGGIALCSQGTVGNNLNGKTESVTRLKIRL
ncbi:hypothetical protein VTK26DRAFT_864 [Humicola hyalothermophila]